MNKQIVLSLLWGALMAFAGQAMAETLYVHDQLRLGVRANPDPAESSIAVVRTGDALTVLGREGDFIRIRTGEGIEGWVSQGYVSAEPPARLQLEQVRSALVQSEGQRTELQDRLAESTSSLEAMENRLAALSAENVALQQQLDTYTTAAERLKREYAWVYQSAVVIALIACAFFLGVGWHKRRVRQRLGGMEI
ncbi:MAG: TIGR04211 family SH3 domain-containing protein [Pseudomonadota bacterium]